MNNKQLAFLCAVITQAGNNPVRDSWDEDVLEIPPPSPVEHVAERYLSLLGGR